MIKNIIPALDGMNRDEVFEYLTRLNGAFETVKIGMELFYREGPQIVRDIHKEFGVKIFLDLKLYDIPNTVSSAIKSLEGLSVEFLTIHLSGGEEMVIAAMKSAERFLPSTKILGVSYLTSLDKDYFLQIQDLEEVKIQEAFKRLFELASKTGIHGIVCSAQELPQLGKFTFLKVCPGIRFEDEIQSGKLGDQKRVMNPSLALKDGADYLVMGRSLRGKDLEQRILELNSL